VGASERARDEDKPEKVVILGEEEKDVESEKGLTNRGGQGS